MSKKKLFGRVIYDGFQTVRVVREFEKVKNRQDRESIHKKRLRTNVESHEKTAFN